MPPDDSPASDVFSRRKRLTAIDPQPLLPLVRAYQIADCQLYWIPESFPPPSGERRWLMRFFDQLFALLIRQYGLRIEVFVQYKTVMDHMRLFQSTAVEFAPILGISRRPSEPLRPPPSMDDLRPILEGKRQFHFKEWVPDYCYWFHRKNEQRQREVFLGCGGLTMIALAPDPATAPPKLPLSETFRNKYPIFRMIDIEALLRETSSLRDSFHSKTKEIFGEDLKADPRYPGMLFILPLLSASEFFDRSPEERQKWFEAFDVYINESPADRGLVFATKLDLEQQIVRIIAELREEFANP